MLIFQLSSASLAVLIGRALLVVGWYLEKNGVHCNYHLHAFKLRWLMNLNQAIYNAKIGQISTKHEYISVASACFTTSLILSTITILYWTTKWKHCGKYLSQHNIKYSEILVENNFNLCFKWQDYNLTTSICISRMFYNAGQGTKTYWNWTI